MPSYNRMHLFSYLYIEVARKFTASSYNLPIWEA